MHIRLTDGRMPDPAHGESARFHDVEIWGGRIVVDPIGAPAGSRRHDAGPRRQGPLWGGASRSDAAVGLSHVPSQVLPPHSRLPVGL